MERCNRESGEKEALENGDRKTGLYANPITRILSLSLRTCVLQLVCACDHSVKTSNFFQEDYYFRSGQIWIRILVLESFSFLFKERNKEAINDNA